MASPSQAKQPVIALDYFDGMWRSSEAREPGQAVASLRTFEDLAASSDKLAVTTESLPRLSEAMRARVVVDVPRLLAIYFSLPEPRPAFPCLVLAMERKVTTVGLIRDSQVEAPREDAERFSLSAIWDQIVESTANLQSWIRNGEDRRDDGFEAFCELLKKGGTAKIGPAPMQAGPPRNTGHLRERFKHLHLQVDPRQEATAVIFAGWAATHLDLTACVAYNGFQSDCRRVDNPFHPATRGLLNCAFERMPLPPDEMMKRIYGIIDKDSPIVEIALTASKVIGAMGDSGRACEDGLRPYLELALLPTLASTTDSISREKADLLLKDLTILWAELKRTHNAFHFVPMLKAAAPAAGCAAEFDRLCALLEFDEVTFSPGTVLADPDVAEVVDIQGSGDVYVVETTVRSGFKLKGGEVLTKPSVVFRLEKAPEVPQPAIQPVPAPKPWTWRRWTVGALVLAAVAFGAWRYWFQPTLTLEHTLPVGGKVRLVTVSETGGVFSAATAEELGPKFPRTLRTWSTQGWIPMTTFEPKSIAHALSPDGKKVAFSLDGQRLSLAELTGTSRPIALAPSEPHGDHIRSMAFSGDGASLATVADDRQVRVYRIASNLLESSWETDYPPTSVAISMNGAIVAAATRQPSIELWKNRNKWRSLRHPAGAITSVAISGKGVILAAGTKDNKVWLWRLDSADVEKPWHQLAGPSQTVTGVAFSPDERWLAASAGTSIWLWELDGDSATATHHEKAHTSEITGLGFVTQSGATPPLLVTGSMDGNLKLWRLR